MANIRPIASSAGDLLRLRVVDATVDVEAGVSPAMQRAFPAKSRSSTTLVRSAASTPACVFARRHCARRAHCHASPSTEVNTGWDSRLVTGANSRTGALDAHGYATLLQAPGQLALTVWRHHQACTVLDSQHHGQAAGQR